MGETVFVLLPGFLKIFWSLFIYIDVYEVVFFQKKKKNIFE